MERWPAYKEISAVLGFAALLFTGCWWYSGDLQLTLLLLSGACVLLLAFGLFVFRFHWFYLLLTALIPISVDTAVAGGAKLAFPAEGLLSVTVPLLLVFNADYRSRAADALKHPIGKLLTLLVVVMLFAALAGTQVDVSLKRLLIHVLFISGFFLMVQMVGKRESLFSVFLAYALGLIPVMLLTLSNHASLDFDPRAVFDICRPYYNDHTVYGACLAFVLPGIVIALFKGRSFGWSSAFRVFLGLLLLLLFLSEVLALSRAALLSLIVAGAFYVFLRYGMHFRQLILALVCLSGVAWFYSGEIYERIKENEAVSNDGELLNHFSSVSNISSDASNLERINRWICAWRMFEERPLIGFGPGTYQFEYNRFQTMENKTYISTNAGDRGNAHSEYLSALSETGIAGFLVFLALVLSGVYFGMRNHSETRDSLLRRVNLAALLGLITFFFHGLFNAFLDQSKMAFLVYTSLGIIVWIHRYNQANETENRLEENG